MALDAAAAGLLDLLGERGDRLGAELARLGLQRVRGQDERGGVAAVHRLLDLLDRFLAVLAEIGEDAHEARPELGAHLLEFLPVDDLASPASSTIVPFVTRTWPYARPSKQGVDEPGRTSR